MSSKASERMRDMDESRDVIEAAVKTNMINKNDAL